MGNIYVTLSSVFWGNFFNWPFYVHFGQGLSPVGLLSQIPFGNPDSP